MKASQQKCAIRKILGIFGLVWLLLISRSYAGLNPISNPNQNLIWLQEAQISESGAIRYSDGTIPFEPANLTFGPSPGGASVTNILKFYTLTNLRTDAVFLRFFKGEYFADIPLITNDRPITPNSGSATNQVVTQAQIENTIELATQVPKIYVDADSVAIIVRLVDSARRPFYFARAVQVNCHVCNGVSIGNPGGGNAAASVVDSSTPPSTPPGTQEASDGTPRCGAIRISTSWQSSLGLLLIILMFAFILRRKAEKAVG